MILLRLESLPDSKGVFDETVCLDVIFGGDLRSCKEDVDLFRSFLVSLLGGHKFSTPKSCLHSDIVVRHIHRHVTGLFRGGSSHLIHLELGIMRGVDVDLVSFSSENAAHLTKSLKEM